MQLKHFLSHLPQKFSVLLLSFIYYTFLVSLNQNVTKIICMTIPANWTKQHQFKMVFLFYLAGREKWSFFIPASHFLSDCSQVHLFSPRLWVLWGQRIVSLFPLLCKLHWEHFMWKSDIYIYISTYFYVEIYIHIFDNNKCYCCKRVEVSPNFTTWSMKPATAHCKHLHKCLPNIAIILTATFLCDYLDSANSGDDYIIRQYMI